MEKKSFIFDKVTYWLDFKYPMGALLKMEQHYGMSFTKITNKIFTADDMAIDDIVNMLYFGLLYLKIPSFKKQDAIEIIDNLTLEEEFTLSEIIELIGNSFTASLEGKKKLVKGTNGSIKKKSANQPKSVI